jgi:hypothetical protein
MRGISAKTISGISGGLIYINCLNFNISYMTMLTVTGYEMEFTRKKETRQT